MSISYIQATVRQKIPADCLAPIERWLLTRIFNFKTEERGGSLVFKGCWDDLDVCYGYGVSPDDELTEVLTASREICPELCAEVEREFNNSGAILCTIDYQKIFQSIVRRHPDVLHHVSIEEFDCNTRRGLRCETLTIITAQCIMSINSDGNARNELKPQSPYYITRWRAHSSDITPDVQTQQPRSRS
jgi:hypothetical protein